MVPNYISKNVPDKVGTNAPYDLRNASDYTVLNIRTQIYANSFISSCVALWNALPEELRYAESIETFKRNLTNTYFKVEPLPLYYLVGSWKRQVLFARLRNVYSDLSFDIFQNGLITNAKCSLCGHEIEEDAEHFLCDVHLSWANEYDFFEPLAYFIHSVTKHYLLANYLQQWAKFTYLNSSSTICQGNQTIWQ